MDGQLQKVFMATKKKQKDREAQEIASQWTDSRQRVLVGTYRREPDQLKWIGRRHLYNYPISKEEAESMGEGWCKVTELWLYCGTKDKRHIYAAEFIGVVPRQEFLSEHPDYPKGMGKHGDFYAVFQVVHKYLPANNDSMVIVRAKDFAKRSPKIAQAVKAYQADGGLGCLLDYLPADLAPLPHDQLCVCETSHQMLLWELPTGESFKPDVPFPAPERGEFTFIDLFVGIGGIRLGYQSLGGRGVFSSEWDKEAARTYYSNFDERPFGNKERIPT